LANAGSQGKGVDERGVNFMLATIKAIAPKDEAECMLAAQMAVVHMGTMTFARRLTQADTISQQDSVANAFNMLSRTFAVRLEALKRYRTGGEQKVTVQHVAINEGGQAIVGAVSQAPARTGGPKIWRQPHERHARHAPQPALHRHVEADAAPVPGPGSHRLDRLSVPRRARGGGPKGEHNGAYRHGLHTAEAVPERRAVAALLRQARVGRGTW